MNVVIDDIPHMVKDEVEIKNIIDKNLDEIINKD